MKSDMRALPAMRKPKLAFGPDLVKLIAEIDEFKGRREALKNTRRAASALCASWLPLAKPIVFGFAPTDYDRRSGYPNPAVVSAASGRSPAVPVSAVRK